MRSVATSVPAAGAWLGFRSGASEVGRTGGIRVASPFGERVTGKMMTPYAKGCPQLVQNAVLLAGRAGLRGWYAAWITIERHGLPCAGSSFSSSRFASCSTRRHWRGPCARAPSAAELRWARPRRPGRWRWRGAPFAGRREAARRSRRAVDDAVAAADRGCDAPPHGRATARPTIGAVYAVRRPRPTSPLTDGRGSSPRPAPLRAACGTRHSKRLAQPAPPAPRGQVSVMITMAPNRRTGGRPWWEARHCELCHTRIGKLRSWQEPPRLVSGDGLARAGRGVTRAELPGLLRTHRLFCAMCWSNRWGETTRPRASAACNSERPRPRQPAAAPGVASRPSGHAEPAADGDRRVSRARAPWPGAASTAG